MSDTTSQTGYIEPPPRGLRTQDAFRYERDSSKPGHGPYVLDNAIKRVLKDAIKIARAHLFSERGLLMMNEAFSTKVTDFGEWGEHKPRKELGDEGGPAWSRELDVELRRRQIDDGLQIVLDGSLQSRGLAGLLVHERPWELRINDKDIKDVVFFRKHRLPSAELGLVYLAATICHEAVHGLRRTIAGSQFLTPPQLRSRSKTAECRGPVQTIKVPGFASLTVRAQTGEGGWNFEESYFGGGIRRVFAEGLQGHNLPRQIDYLVMMQVDAQGVEELFQLSEAQVRLLHRASLSDLRRLPLKKEAGIETFSTGDPRMGRNFEIISQPVTEAPIAVDLDNLDHRRCGHVVHSADIQ